MALLKHDGKNLAVGLSWLEPLSITSNFRESKVQREVGALKPAPAGYALIATRDSLQPGVSYNHDEIDCQSAAAWLASAQASAILVEKLSNDSYWLCAVEHGAVFPSGDLVGDRNQIETRLGELQMDAAGADIPYYDNSGQFDSLSDAAKAGFSDLVSEFEPDSRGICKPLKKHRFKTSRLALAASLLIALGGFASWQIYHHRLSDAEHINAANIEKERSAAFTEEKSRLETKLNQDAGALLKLFVNMIYNRPVRAGGWEVESHEWKSNTIETVWKRSYGSISDLAAHLGSRQWRLDESSGTVTEHFELPAPRLDSRPAESILGGIQARHDFLDDLSLFPGSWTLEPSVSSGRLYRVRKSMLHGSSDRLSSALAAAGRMRGHPLHVTEINAVFTDQTQWSIHGEYYESAR